ncbi:Lrp/AsnC family transcriptional regulator [Lutispora saccharofermentans]|uniref:Lrp/AsnC family transcriptional regulator n=1 Tax=Lutispora saccharofermentans TaxID=3024236 RepID=A0ABT1NF61_9FIRM|nr:Lrp/AsnC family transcriptional regulator [Lutispora saccharofermentans]MCQ1529249.1 Lrp/AsnC family transcriptional regulator [Lutispora saccharofermentans]
MDIKILEILENEGRITHEEMAKRLNISRPAIHQRVSKLEQSGVIKGYKTVIEWSKAGQALRALIFINVRTSDFNSLMNEIVNIKIEGLDIEECFRITGQWCIMLRIRTIEAKQITCLHDEILKKQGVTETFTMLILSEMSKGQINTGRKD